VDDPVSIEGILPDLSQALPNFTDVQRPVLHHDPATSLQKTYKTYKYIYNTT